MYRFQFGPISVIQVWIQANGTNTVVMITAFYGLYAAKWQKVVSVDEHNDHTSGHQLQGKQLKQSTGSFILNYSIYQMLELSGMPFLIFTVYKSRPFELKTLIKILHRRHAPVGKNLMNFDSSFEEICCYCWKDCLLIEITTYSFVLTANWRSWYSLEFRNSFPFQCTQFHTLKGVIRMECEEK